MEGRFVVYYRVSTQRQGESGLGLEAQQRAVEAFLNGGSWTVVKEFTEVETGKRGDRPVLREAIELAKMSKATLLIAKLDRLARNLHFITGLQEAKVRFKACDMPDADEFTINVLAAVAQKEAKDISERTKAGLASIKARLEAGEEHISRTGRVVTKLGNPNGLKQARRDLGTAALVAKADEFAATVRPTILSLSKADLSLAQIADHLNQMGVKTARGASWAPMSVKRVMDRQPKA